MNERLKQIEQGLASLIAIHEQAEQRHEKWKAEFAKQAEQRQAEADKQIREIRESQRVAQEESDKQIRELRKSQAKTDEKLKKLGIYIGRVSNNQADIIEAFVAATLERYNKIWGITFDSMGHNIKNRVGKIEREYDVVLYNGNIIVIVEIKSKAHVNDLDDFEAKVRDFRYLFPAYEDYTICIGIASPNMNEDVIRECEARGFGAIRIAGEKLEESGNLKAF